METRYIRRSLKHNKKEALCFQKLREKSIAMTRRTHMLPVFLVTVLTLLATAPKLWAIPFSQTRIIIETNATAGDAGIQIFLDATGWKSLEISDPNGRKSSSSVPTAAWPRRASPSSSSRARSRHSQISRWTSSWFGSRMVIIHSLA
jgi:hypothetical protein